MTKWRPGLSPAILLQKVRQKPVVANPLLVAASASFVLALLASLETASRLYDPQYLIRTRDVCVFSPVYGWDTRKGVSAVVEGKPVTLNKYGYRGRPLTLSKSRDATRVALIGDSVAFGFHAGDDETFAHGLDVRDNGLEVINLAVQGFGPDQELLKLTNEGLAWRPDIVILAHCVANDFADAVLPVFLYDGVMPKPRFRLEKGALVLEDSQLRLTGLQRLQCWLADYSFFFNRILDARQNAPARWKEASGIQDSSDAVPHWGERYEQAMGDQEHALRLNVALVHRMAIACQERGVRFVVAVFPGRKSYYARPPLIEGFFEALALNDIPTIDMAEGFRERDLCFGQVAYDGIGHLTPAGHRAASEIIERSLVTQLASGPLPRGKMAAAELPSIHLPPQDPAERRVYEGRESNPQCQHVDRAQRRLRLVEQRASRPDDPDT
jgi:hypothetical protein